MGKISEFQQAAFQSSATPGAIDEASFLPNAINRVANVFEERALKIKAAEDLAFASSRSVDLETLATKRMQEWQQTYGESPMDKEEFLQNSIQSDIDELTKNAPSEDARASLQRMGDDVKRRMSVNGTQWAHEQTVKNIATDLDRSSQSLQLAAFRSGDPRGLDDLFKQHDTLVAAASATLSPDAVQKMNATGKRNMVASMVEGMIDRDRLGDAQRVLDSKKYDEVLGAETTQKAYGMIQKKREAAQNRWDKLQDLKYKDPWKYLAETGETKRASPLALTGDPTEIAKSFEKRETFQSDVRTKHGIDLPFMSDREVDVFSDSIMNMNPRQAADVMHNLGDLKGPTGPQRAQFGRQLFKKEPGLAVGLMVAGEAPDETRRIIGGMNLLRKGDGGKAINAPNPNDVDTEFDSLVGEALVDPSMRIAVKQAATAHMVSSQFEAGKREFDMFAPKDFKTSVEKIMGPVAEVNGSKTLSFRGKSGKFVDPDDLEDLVDDLTDSQVEKAQGDVPRTVGGQPINLKKSRGRLQLKAIGEGTYWIQTEEGIALDKNKQPFRLNLKAIEGKRSASAGGVLQSIKPWFME